MKEKKTAKKTEITSRSGEMKYTEVLELRAAIKTEIEDTKKDYFEAADTAASALNQVREKDLAISRYKQKIQQENKEAGFSSDFVEPQQEERLKILEQTAADTDQHAAELIKKKKELNGKINSLQNDLANFDVFLSTKEVLIYQDDLANAEKNVDDLLMAITNQENIIEKAQKTLPLFPENAKKREDLLAEIATGGASSDSLEKLDERIEVEHKEYEKKQTKMLDITVPAQEAIEGLKRRLITAKNELSIIKSKKSPVLCEFMMGEADRIGEEYVKLSLKLVEKFEQLIALDKIMGSSTNLRCYGTEKFMIPLLNVRACKGKGHHSHPGQFWAVRDAFSNQKTTESYKAECERITKLGIHL
jgi:hypothetical protein